VIVAELDISGQGDEAPQRLRAAHALQGRGNSKE
jgi:hypothetical protein